MYDKFLSLLFDQIVDGFKVKIKIKIKIKIKKGKTDFDIDIENWISMCLKVFKWNICDLYTLWESDEMGY